MSDASEKLKVVGDVLNQLRAKLHALTGNVSANNGFKAWATDPLGKALESYFNVGSSSDGLEEVISVSNKAIATLEETMSDALVADSAYERWVDLAQSVEDNLSNAMGVAGNDLRRLFESSSKAFVENLGSAGEKIKDELAWPTVSIIAILLCVVVIVVFK